MADDCVFPTGCALDRRRFDAVFLCWSEPNSARRGKARTVAPLDEADEEK